MSISRREPREIYRVYDEDEFFSTARCSRETGGTAPQRPDGEALAGGGGEEIPERESRVRSFRRPRPVAMLIAVAIGAAGVAVIELQALVARPGRAVEPHRPGFSGAKSIGRTRRARRTRVSLPRGRRGRGREMTGARAENRVAASAPNLAIMPGSRSSLASPADAGESAHEFGFEQ